MQLHLLFVNLPNVEYLVDQVEYALGIAVDGVERGLEHRGVVGLEIL